MIKKRLTNKNIRLSEVNINVQCPDCATAFLLNLAMLSLLHNSPFDVQVRCEACPQSFDLTVGNERYLSNGGLLIASSDQSKSANYCLG